MGAGRVIVVDHVEYRLEFVRKFANCEIVNFKEVRDMAIHIKRMTDWLGADVCIDAVGCEAAGNAMQHLTGVVLPLQAGSATALHWCINSVRKGGTVSIVGVYGPTFNAVPIGNALNKRLTLCMNQASVKRHLPRLIEHIQAGRVKPSEVITHHERPGMTPVFGTSVPPSGLSGKMRALAFRYSENDIRHWLILLAADRVNVGEGLLEDLAHGHVPNV